SFYVRYDAIKFSKINSNTFVQVEKIGKIEYKYNKHIPQLKKYVNPRISHDGMYWYLSLGFEHEDQIVKLNDLSIGIDVGIKDLAIVSHLDKPIKNINKSSKVKKTKKRLRRLQRQVSRKYEMNREGKKY